jgi:imidazolonepropionase-like amidohydrolase
MLARFAPIALLFISVSAPTTAAEEGSGCDKLAWPLARERAWLAAAEKPTIAAGTTIAAMPKAAFVLSLQPNGKASFALPPERQPKADAWFGGMLSLPAVEKPGLYQVTLSDEAWIDVVQNGRYLKAVAHTGRHDCPGARKSIRFEITQAPFIVQLSDAPRDAMAVAIGSAE